MARRKLIAANWKMYKTMGEATTFAGTLKASLPALSGCDLMLFPPFFALHGVARELAGTPVAVGAQDLFWEREGAFTGEISGAMIADAGGTAVLVGHSERRAIMGEDDEIVARKLKSAFAAGLNPILCVGENLQDRESGNATKVVKKQLTAAIAVTTKNEIRNLVIAYEPVWAIGTGKTATPENAEEMHRFIREFISARFGSAAGDELRIQYGGSVKPANAANLLSRAEIDGALIGGASLDVDSFVAIAAASGK
jgi:triosephosphate isomerase